MGALAQDDRPLGERLPELAEGLRAAEMRGRERSEAKRREAERRREEALVELRRWASDSLRDSFPPTLMVSAKRAAPQPAIDFKALAAPVPRPPAIRVQKDLSPERRLMSSRADHAARVFDTQAPTPSWRNISLPCSDARNSLQANASNSPAAPIPPPTHIVTMA